MSESSAGLEYLDDIGLGLSILVFVFVCIFHFRPNDRRSWDKKIGAWLIIWLLAYYVLFRMQGLYEVFYFKDPTNINGFVSAVYGITGDMNYFLVHIFLLLLVPIPFLRDIKQVWAMALVVVLFWWFGKIMGNVTGEFHVPVMMNVMLVMLCATVAVGAAVRFQMFPPDNDDTSDEALALRRSGYFAMGTICVIMDNMIFRTIGFFTDGIDAYWTFPTVNWGGVSEGYIGWISTQLNHAIILGCFAFFMIAFLAGAIVHFVQLAKKKHSTGLPTLFSGYIIFLWILIIFRNWAVRTGTGEWSIFGEALNEEAVLIDALTDSFTFHLIYPTIALLHAVKFGLINIDTERDRKILRVTCLGVMVGIAAIFTEILQEIVNVPDIAFAVLCGLVLATGWEKKLIDALEPSEEMKVYSWDWPGNNKTLLYTVNITVGATLIIHTLLGVIF